MDNYTNEKRALILAAGLGTRLAPITNDRPKALVPVNGQPILLKQIDNLHKNGIYNITIVAGYKADILKKLVHEKFPEIKIIESIDYATTNNMYSAYLVKEIVGKHEFLMMNGDVFFDSSIVTSLINCEAENAIAVDMGKYMEESMKVVEYDNHIVQISKKITPKEALGVSIDVYKFSVEGGNSFFAKCSEYIEQRKELNLWSEVALNDILNSIEFKACPFHGRWVEIDNHDDLTEAERLFKEDIV